MLVIGCGPIGLAVIQSLRLHHVHAIVAADFHLDGASSRVGWEPTWWSIRGVSSPYEKWLELAGHGETLASPLGDFFPPVPGLRPALFFECVGVPGVIAQMMEGAPRGARIVVVGACMQDDENSGQ